MQSKILTTTAQAPFLILLELNADAWIYLLLSAFNQPGEDREHLKSNLIASCKTLQSFFAQKQTSSWATRKPMPLITDILTAIVNGEQEKMRKMVCCFPQLLLERADVKVMGGQLLKNMTPLEVAIWGFDKHMWLAIVDAVSDQNMVKALLVQAQQFVPLQPKAVMDFTPSITAYETVVQSFQKNQRQLNQDGYWEDLNTLLLNIGKAQKTWPVAIRNEFCKKNSTTSESENFDSDSLSRDLYFYDYLRSEHQTFGREVAGLGESFIIISGDGLTFGNDCWLSYAHTLTNCVEGIFGILSNSKALATYNHVRMASDLPALISQLENLVITLNATKADPIMGSSLVF